LRSTGLDGGFLSASSIRVLVADDYEPWRGFVSATLHTQPNLQLVAEASDGLEALEKAQELQAEMILLDINLPKLNGFEVVRRVREQMPQMKIIFFSADRSLDTAEDALRMGADGYVVKSDAGKELVPALKAVLGGTQFVSSSLADRISRLPQPVAL
jgi:DNA-binding NarL/FixJ family response regulator